MRSSAVAPVHGRSQSTPQVGVATVLAPVQAGPLERGLGTQFQAQSRPLLLRSFHLLASVFAFALLFSLGIAFSLVDVVRFSKGIFSEMFLQFEIFLILLTSSGVVSALALIIISNVDHARRHSRHEPTCEVDEGLNFLLRIGLVVFAMGAVVLHILRAISPAEESNGRHCLIYADPSRLALLLMSSLLLLLQTYFLFKYHRRRFHLRPRLIRAILGHLVLVNLLGWTHTAILQAMEVLDSTPRYEEGIVTASVTTTMGNGGYADCKAMKIAAKTAQPFLSPCLIEYSIVAAGALANLYRRVEINPRPVRSRQVTDLSMLVEEVPRDVARGRMAVRRSFLDFLPSSASPYLGGQRSEFFHKSHRGCFVGVLLCALFLVVTVVELLLLKNKDGDPEVRMLLYFMTQGEAIFINAVALAVVVVLTVKMTFRFHFKPGMDLFVDRALMYLAFVIHIIYSTFIILADINNLAGEQRPTLSLSLLFLLSHLLELIQSSVQAVFILTGINLRALNRYQRHWKPGKNYLMVLIIINLLVMAHESVLMGYNINAKHYVAFFGLHSWTLLVSAFKPLVVFYRFHSASMVAEMWNNAYV